MEELSLNSDHQQHQINNSNDNNKNNNISLINNNNINISKNKSEKHQLNLTKNNLNNTLIINNNNSKNKISFGHTNSNNNSNMVSDNDLKLQVKNYLRNTKLSPIKFNHISKPLQLPAMNNTSNHVKILSPKNRLVLNRTMNATSTPLRLRNVTSVSNNIASKLNATFPSVKSAITATGKWLHFNFLQIFNSILISLKSD